MTTAADRAPTLRIVRRKYGENIIRNMLAIRCDECGKESDKSARPDIPEEAIARMYRGAGWLVDSECRTAVCPKCQERPNVSDISTAAIKRQRQMYVLLDSHFDEDKGRYREDWSDAKVAKDTGLAETVVAQHREAAYGPIKPNMEIVGAGKELADLRLYLANEFADLTKLFEQTKRDAEDRIGSLETKISRYLKGAAR